MGWIYLSEDRISCRILNTVMKPRLPLNVGNFLASEGTVPIPKEDSARES